MDKMREEFESKMRTMGMFEQGSEAMARCGETGGYEDQDTNAMWSGFQIGWKASRAALCVKLPSPELGDCANGLIVDVGIALNKAGVRYE